MDKLPVLDLKTPQDIIEYLEENFPELTSFGVEDLQRAIDHLKYVLKSVPRQPSEIRNNLEFYIGEIKSLINDRF